MAKLTLRLPASLKNRIQRLSEEEGISMNQFITLAAAEKATSLESASTDWQRAVLEAWAEEGRTAAKSAGYAAGADYLQALLERAPDIESPREEDRLSPVSE